MKSGDETCLAPESKYHDGPLFIRLSYLSMYADATIRSSHYAYCAQVGDETIVDSSIVALARKLGEDYLAVKKGMDKGRMKLKSGKVASLWREF